MRILSAGVVAALLMSTGIAIADPAGRYVVDGTSPGGGGKYTGTVVVAHTGDTFSVTWIVAGRKFVGTGIGDKDFLAVSYKSGNDTGLALYGSDAADWTGVWTYQGGTQMGTEHWTRQ